MDGVQVSFWVIAMLVMLALAFDFMNGFHDAANSIATVVSTGVLKPQQAVLFAAFFNFIAIAIFQLKIAATVGKGIVEPGIVDYHVVFGALVGAITWNVITWFYGIPSSSSHALIGGIVGSVTALFTSRPLPTRPRRLRWKSPLPLAAVTAPRKSATRKRPSWARLLSTPSTARF